MSGTFLLADMGGTNIRFAVLKDKEVHSLQCYKCADFPTFSDALKKYRDKVGTLPENFVLAVPAPVGGDEYSFVNNPWRFSVRALKKEFAFTDMRLINDFEAAAMAIPYLSADDVVQVEKGQVVQNAPRLIMGAGTGLGTGILIPLDQGKYKSLASEGGHINIAPTSGQEEKIKAHLLTKFARVSAERVISGQGLQNIYDVFAGQSETPERIVAAALSGDDVAKAAVLQMFAFWGDVAGDLALAIGARGGVYLSGGMMLIDGIIDLFNQSDFCARFENKGRYAGLIKQMPLYIITRSDTAFLGLSAFAEQG